MLKQLISIIIPAYNEEENIEKTYAAIVNELKKHHDLEYEIIFTDNASTDKTFEKLAKISKQDAHVRVIRFVRNFGFQRSILAGYHHAKGDAAIQIDCDLEDPPSVFTDFIRLWRAGHDVVIGIRSQRIEPLYLRLLRRLYYKILNRISDTPHKIDAGDFRLVDRSILDQLQMTNDRQPYVRGLISELSRNQIGVHYKREKRQFGKSKFRSRQLLKMATESFYTNSTMPLRLATYCGLSIALVTTIMMCVYLILHLFFSQQIPRGFTTITLLILFGISLNALFLGIIGEYIGRIYNQVRKRPLVVIEKALNIKPKNLLLTSQSDIEHGF